MNAADPNHRYSIDTHAMDWASSPSSTVWRKRLYRRGGEESGIVTSVVRYDPGSTFHAHDHPQGEEILVLDGIFSDDHGDWPEGTYLLHPEGFRHAPFSHDGCLLFVRLRQYAGANRKYVALDTHKRRWRSTSTPGITRKGLYAQREYADTSHMERWAPELALPQRRYSNGAEVFVLDGSFRDETGEYGRYHWLRFPPGAGHTPSTVEGCRLFIRLGLNNVIGAA